MFTHSLIIRVAYADTDQMGFVHHSRYVIFYETASTEALRKLGIRYKDIEESGVAMPVVSMKIDYIKPAYYDELLSVKTMIRKMPSARMKFEYECYNEANILINTAETTLAFIDKQNRKPCHSPDVILKALLPFFTEKFEGQKSEY